MPGMDVWFSRQISGTSGGGFRDKLSLGSSIVLVLYAPPIMSELLSLISSLVGLSSVIKYTATGAQRAPVLSPDHTDGSFSLIFSPTSLSSVTSSLSTSYHGISLCPLPTMFKAVQWSCVVHRLEQNEVWEKESFWLKRISRRVVKDEGKIFRRNRLLL